MASGCCSRQTRGLKRENLTCLILFASTTVNLSLLLLYETYANEHFRYQDLTKISPPRARHAHRAHRSQIVATISLFTVIRPTPFATCPSLGHTSQGSGKKHCALRLPSLGDQDRSPRSGETIEPIGLLALRQVLANSANQN